MLRIKNVMKKEVLSVSPHDTAFYALELMKNSKIRHLVVIDERGLCGIVTDRDLKGAITIVRVEDPRGSHFSFREAIEVKDIMTKNVVTVTPDHSIHEAARLMAERKIGALPVMGSGAHDGEVIGIVSETDLLQVLVDHIDELKGLTPKVAHKKRASLKVAAQRRS